MNTNNEVVRFSPAFLIDKWAKDNNKVVAVGRATGKTRTEKVKNQNRKAVAEGGRMYKGMSGRISKDGRHGYFDVDERGRYICV